MEARHLLGEYRQSLNPRPTPEPESLLQRFQGQRECVREQSAFLMRQEAKATAAALRDSLEDRLLPCNSNRVAGF